jgi:hypothetical protein
MNYLLMDESSKRLNFDLEARRKNPSPHPERVCLN